VRPSRGLGAAPRSCSRPGSSDGRYRPYTVRTDDALKIRFSATLGEEPEIEVALV
jgi:hypothetical protein